MLAQDRKNLLVAWQWPPRQLESIAGSQSLPAAVTRHAQILYMADRVEHHRAALSHQPPTVTFWL